MDLTKYIITSNQATQELENPHLQSIFARHHITPVTEKNFVGNILPNVVAKMKNIITNKLRRCKHCTLLTDIWSSNQLVDILGCCCSLVYTDFTKETIVIGLRKMNGAHTAENIKEAVEAIVNQYEFDKSKIRGVVSDEGSNFVKWLRQLINENLDLEPEDLDNDYWSELFGEVEENKNDKKQTEQSEAGSSNKPSEPKKSAEPNKSTEPNKSAPSRQKKTDPVDSEIDSILTDEVNPLHFDLTQSKLPQTDVPDPLVDLSDVNETDEYELINGMHTIINEIEFEIGINRL